MKIWIQPSLENNYSVGHIHVVHKWLKNISSCCLRVRARWRCIIWKHWQKPFWSLNSLKKEEWPLLRSYIKVQFKQTLWSSGLLTWNLKWSILYCPMLCRRTYGGLCHFKLSILPYYNLIISLYRSLNSNAVISADDVSLKGKSTRDIYWNAIIAVTHIYRFSPMGFLGWGYRLQMLTHLSLSHPPTFSLTHTPQPLYSHNTVIDLVKGPRFIFLCTGDVSIENTSCVWGRKLARQHRMLYAADTMGRGSQWHPAEPVAHNVGLQQVGLKALQMGGGGSTAIRCITSRAQEMLASLLVVTQMFKLNKALREVCRVV